jgi:hypothetical protein
MNAIRRTLKGSRVFTAQVVLHNGWELRPYAYQTRDGAFVPELCARRHQPGCRADIVTLDMTCRTKDDAFSEALKRGLGLARTA